MKFDVSAFNRLRPIAFRLGKWTKFYPPRISDNSLRTVVEFARFMKMREIPSRTADKLRNDPYFRYSFYQVIEDFQIHGFTAPAGREIRQRMVELLKNPGLCNDRDLEHGLVYFLNNFIGYLPGGHIRVHYHDWPEDFVDVKPVLDAVDEVLREKGIKEETVLTLRSSMRLKAEGEEGGIYVYSKRVEFLKLCLEIFKIMIERYKFDPEMLWR